MGYGNMFALQIASHKDNWYMLCPQQFLTTYQMAPAVPSPWTSGRRFIPLLHSSAVPLISFCLTALCVRWHPFWGQIACLIGLYFFICFRMRTMSRWKRVVIDVSLSEQNMKSELGQCQFKRNYLLKSFCLDKMNWKSWHRISDRKWPGWSVLMNPILMRMALQHYWTHQVLSILVKRWYLIVCV